MSEYNNTTNVIIINLILNLENIHYEIHEMHSTADEICPHHLNILSVVKFKF